MNAQGNTCFAIKRKDDTFNTGIASTKANNLIHFSPYWLPLIQGDDCKKIRSTATTADDSVLVKWQLDLCHWLVKQVFWIFPESGLSTASQIFLPRLDVSCLLNDTALLFASRLLTSGFNRTTLRHWINNTIILVCSTQEQWNSSMVSLF